MLVHILLLGCSGSAQESDSPPSEYIRNEAENPGVIVFVHGVTGNSKDTWTHPVSGAYWPNLIANDSAFNGFNVYVYNYPSPALGKSYNIDEVAENMRLVLSNDKVFNHKQVVFLCHSMGGLVTRSYLLKNRDLIPKVAMAYFFATPTTGSEVAGIAKLLSNNPQFGKMLSMDSDSYLADKQRDWQSAGITFPCYCAYEVRETYGQKIVQQQSATNLCNKRLDPIDANHIDIVKPANTGSIPYIAFKSAFEEVFTQKTQALNDWKRYMDVRITSGTCPDYYIPPTDIPLIEGSMQSNNQLYNHPSGYPTWPIIADIHSVYNHFVTIESTLKGIENSWIKLENKFAITFSVDTAAAPKDVDVVLMGECGDGGDPRYTKTVIGLDPANAEKRIPVSFNAHQFYTLQPGEFELFAMNFTCKVPGVYSIQYELPFSISGKTGQISHQVREEKFRIVCPKSYTLWDTGFLDERNTLTRIETYRWDGQTYQGKAHPDVGATTEFREKAL
ncbi:esterase/lipase family protein [Larkinella sp. VNQ87]|uniref:esterase/lipase family protein n=1 Tax=Larkinella sp. VNQ87 TaxID=3400921 RepID=UPI003C0D3BCA